MPDNHLKDNKFLVVIAGPTASGKTRLAADVAGKYYAEVFSADSRQIYREMNIGTARPTMDEMAGIPHHFIGEASIFDSWSTGRYIQNLSERLSDYFTSHEVAVLSGGTGLYIKALLEGLDNFPAISESTKTIVREKFARLGIRYLKEELLIRDPVYYEMADTDNPRRLIRALEVCLEAGVPYSSFFGTATKPRPLFTPVMILLEWPREELYCRINERVDRMMAQGLLEEARGLLPYRGIPALDTVGYRELFDYLEGKTDFKTAVSLIRQNTRRYAKRQMTWFRKYGDWTVFHPEAKEDIFRHIEEKFENITNRT